MRQALVSGFVFGLLLSGTCDVQAAKLAAGDLEVGLDDYLNVTEITVGGVKLKVAPQPLLALCDVAGGRFSPPAVTGGDLAGGLTLRFEEAKATATLRAKPRGGVFEFSCSIRGDDLPARGLLLRFAFPFDAAGWRWHKDMQTSVPIDEAKMYENIKPLRAWADLPEWKDQPDLRMGYSNRNFATVVTGPAGLCLAVPMDRPCIHRTAYNGKAGRLEIVYDFALVPESRKPNQVGFVFDLYACDPKWGFRDALARYYQLFPGIFDNYVKEPGQWMAFRRLSEIDNVNEFYFALQEGASEPQYDDLLGVLSTTYFTHAGMGATIPNYDPEKDPLPPHDVQVQAMETAFKKRTGIKGLYHRVGLRNAEGKLDVRKWRVYAHLIAQFNLDPELPYGAWTLKRAVAYTEKVKKSKNATLDGFYYDGLSAGINYNSAHFKTANSPCLWDPVAKKPLLNNFFSSCEFARAAAELMRPRGQITMMNGALGASFYVAPWLDVLGAETGVRISRERLNYIRSITHHKPFLTLLKGNFEKKLGRPEIELHMKQCLAYGIPPGFFDWMPSGLGPGGCYWYHARYFERDRDLFRKYEPLCRALGMAGWEPLTYAHSSDPKVFVERFGPKRDGILWLTLLNENRQPAQTTLTVETKPLGLDADRLKAVDTVTGTPINLKKEGEVLSARVDIPADGVMAIQLAAPSALAQWRTGQALETLDRGVRMREIDKEKPPVAVHWRPARGSTYSRDTVDGKPYLLFTGSDGAARIATQWVMPFQPKPAKMTLRVRAKGEGLVGGKGTIGVRCRLAWVTPSFTHYETRFFDLPTGTYDWKDCQFDIEVPQPLRAIHVAPQIARGVKGTLRLARISLSDAGQAEYAADPEFSQWYDPVPASMRGKLDESCRQLRAALVKLEGMAGPSGQPTAQAVQAALGQCKRLREFIAREHAENGCRRVLRDLETIERHLGFVPGSG